MNLIIDNISGNFIDFRKFFALFNKPLAIYDRESEVFKSTLSLLGKIAAGMSKRDSESTEMMFQEIALNDLLQVGENEYKRGAISSVILEFVKRNSESYFELLQKIKKFYSADLKTFISYITHFLDIICRNSDPIDEKLWNEFFYYGFSSLTSPSPTTRSNGARLISLLFTEVGVASDEVISEKMPALKKLISDPWWEVRAQGLIIYKAILISKFKSQSLSEPDNLNQDLNIKTLLHFIL